jgi:hypothetical protein
MKEIFLDYAPVAARERTVIAMKGTSVQPPLPQELEWFERNRRNTQEAFCATKAAPHTISAAGVDVSDTEL